MQLEPHIAPASERTAETPGMTVVGGDAPSRVSAHDGVRAGVEDLLQALKAAADETRLKIIALCRRSELTVSDLTWILGQSQPRVSRHLKLLCDARVLERAKEGSWVHFRLAEKGAAARLAEQIDLLLDSDGDDMSVEMERLDEIRVRRQQQAQAYFSRNAGRWDSLRRMHVSEREVETALHAMLGTGDLGDVLDLGTGTGRMLSVLGGRTRRAVGVDLNPEMLAIARAALDTPDCRHVQVRQADITRLPFAAAEFDLVLASQVLHFVEDPRAVVASGARVLRPGGRIVIVDFLNHDREELRRDHAHRRLGFSDDEVLGWFRQAGLVHDHTLHLPGKPLTVGLWSAHIPEGSETP